MRSETLQFCICAQRVLRLRDEFKIVVIGAVRNVRRYSDNITYTRDEFVCCICTCARMHAC